MNNKIKDTIKNYATRFNQQIDRFFPFPEGIEKRVTEAMYYSLTRGGKRLRPFLVYETARIYGVDFDSSINTAMSLEMLHTYSLIHDDLPAMDNDDLRRGFPTCHKKFDEATAIIAGDGLLTYSFEIMSHPSTCSNPQTRCQLISMLANAAGAFNGMVAGQMLDLIGSAYNYPDCDQEELIKHLEELKTGRLLRYAVEAGAILGQAPQKDLQQLINYARKIGIAFQISDDILDETGDARLMGKRLKKDEQQNKLTFVHLYGLNDAAKIATNLIQSACKDIEYLGPRGQNLQDLALYIINRDH